MRVLLFHCSDLFYPTGTAVIFRRVLAPLAAEHEIFHAFAFPRSPLGDVALHARYRDEAGGIRPVDLGGSRVLPAFSRVMRRFTGRDFVTVHSHLYAVRLRWLIAHLRPDLLWWSADYMHSSLEILDLLRRRLGERTPLHLSVYDPPGFWQANSKTRLNYQRALQNAISIDAIGENLRSDIAAQTGHAKPVSILNDYVERPFHPLPAAAGPLRAVVTGQIFGAPEMQRLLDLLGTFGREIRLDWYGGTNNYLVIDQLAVPRSVTLQRMGSLPRERVAEAVANAHFGYFNMPADNADFCRYSIPTKLVTYLEAALPVVFHAPDFSEVSQMNHAFGYGINLGVETDACAALRGLLDRRAEFQEGARRAVTARYERERVLAVTRSILQVRPPAG